MAKIIMFVVLILSLAIGLISMTNGQLIKLGKCPLRKSLTPIEPGKLTGVWYELEREAMSSDWRYDCVRVKVEPALNGSAPATLTGWNRATKKMSTKSMKLRMLDTDPDSSLYTVESKGRNSTMQILATDHKNWVLNYNCEELGTMKALRVEKYWIFSRLKEFSKVMMTEIQTALTHFSIKRAHFYHTNQECKD